MDLELNLMQFLKNENGRSGRNITGSEYEHITGCCEQVMNTGFQKMQGIPSLDNEILTSHEGLRFKDLFIYLIL